MAARTKARKRALDILYEAEIRREPVLELLAERTALASPPVSPYAAELVRGVQAHSADIDDLIARYAADWTLDRMPAVDRNVLRIGAYELLYAAEVPDAVAISEAVALARELSTSGSPGFVNGLLGRLYELKPELGLSPGPPEPEPAEPGSPAQGSSEPGSLEPEPAEPELAEPELAEPAPEPGSAVGGEKGLHGGVRD